MLSSSRPFCDFLAPLNMYQQSSCYGSAAGHSPCLMPSYGCMPGRPVCTTRSWAVLGLPGSLTWEGRRRPLSGD